MIDLYREGILHTGLPMVPAAAWMSGGLERVGRCRRTVDRDGAVHVVVLQCVDVADVAVHDCHDRLAMIVAMTKANEMAGLVERHAPNVICRDATTNRSA
jgi:chemotaxis regulatin CheY-phosphate phosphatase CheZ